MPEVVTYVRQPPQRSVWGRMKSWLARARWIGPFTLNQSSDKAILESVFGDYGRTAAGIHVSPEMAFTFSALYDGVNQIASDVAKMPLNLMKRLPNGGSQPYVESKLYRLLKHQPNPEMGSMVFRRQLTAWALVDKGGFAEIQRDEIGRPVALWPIEPHRVDVERDGRGALQYRVDGETVIPAADMLHIQALGYTPHHPYGLINMARQAIGLALAAERFGASFFGNGATFGGILTTDQPLSEEEARALKKTLESMHKGPDRAHALAVLWGGFDLKQIGVTPHDAQMNDLRDKQVEEVARFLRMPPHRLGLTKPGMMSYNSVEMMNLDYYTGCLLDWITLWEEECNRKLIPALEFRTQYVKHNANVFLRGDFKTRMDGYAIALDKGLYSRNEVRALEDMGPQDGEQGDWYLVQAAQVPLHMLADVTKASMAPPEPPAPPPAGDDDEPERSGPLVEMIAVLRSELEGAIAKRAAAEATATATAEQLAAMRESEAQRSAQIDELTRILDSQRADLAVAEQARREAEAAAAKEADARAKAEAVAAKHETEAAELREALAHAEQVRAELEAAVTEAQTALAATETRETQAKADAEAAQQLLAETEARLAAATGDKSTLEAERDAAAALVAETEGRLSTVAGELEAARAGLTAAETARAEAVAAQADAEQRAAAAEAARAAAALEAAEAVRQAAAAREAAAQAQQAAEAAQAAADERVRAMVEQDTARRSAVLAAGRTVLVEALAGLVRREVSLAKSKDGTQEKFRAWLKGFRVVHQPLCEERLLSAIRLCLVLNGSDADPVETTERIVTEHLDTFEAKMRAVLETEPEEFYTALDKTLRSWEAFRPEAVADRLLVEGVRHVA